VVGGLGGGEWGGGGAGLGGGVGGGGLVGGLVSRGWGVGGGRGHVGFWVGGGWCGEFSLPGPGGREAGTFSSPAYARRKIQKDGQPIAILLNERRTPHRGPGTDGFCGRAGK